MRVRIYCQARDLGLGDNGVTRVRGVKAVSVSGDGITTVASVTQWSTAPLVTRGRDFGVRKAGSGE